MNIKQSTYVVCIAKLIVKENKLDEALKIFAELKTLSSKEPGCLRYELHQDQENPLHFTFIDRFIDMEAFNQHCQQDYTIKYFDHILPNLTESIDINLHNEIIL